MRDLKDRIERRFNIMWGTFRTPEARRDDFRFMLRIGAGSQRNWPNVEAAVAGRSFYFARIDWSEVGTVVGRP